MGGVVFNSVIFSSALLIICCVLKAINVIWWRPRKFENHLRRQGLRGTSYSIFLGDLREIGRLYMEAWSKPMSLNHDICQRVLPFYHQMVQNYGKICLSWNGIRPVLIVLEPDAVRCILTDKHDQFQKPPMNPLIDLLTRGVSSFEREKWAKRRKLITPAFHHDKLKGMIPAFTTSCCHLLDSWKKLASPQGHFELDIAPDFQNLAADVIARAAFGSSYEEGRKIFEFQKEQIVLVLEAAHSIYFPGLRFIPTKKNRRRYKVDNEIKKAFRTMIHKYERAVGNGEKVDEDLLALLLKCKDEADNDMADDDVIEECKLFYFAGKETTANLLIWTMILLSTNLDWQDKAREEVLQFCGDKPPDIDSINHFKIMTMIFNEVLRLYPPLANIVRHTYKSVNIGGMSIPAGVDLVLPTLFLHYDPKYWGDDVLEFKPERFSEGVSNASTEQSFYPFGWGPRICLGQNFAMIEAKMTLAMILQHFWFELSPSYVHAPYTVITIQPQHGAPLILHKL